MGYCRPRARRPPFNLALALVVAMVMLAALFAR